MKMFLKVMGTLFACLVTVYVSVLIPAFSDGDRLHLALVSIGGVIGLFLVCFFIWQWFETKKKRIVMAIMGSIMVVFVLNVAAQEINRAYHKSFHELNESLDTSLYQPFHEGSKAAALDEPSELALVDDLPRIDGSAMVFPLYSAFVQAVYPPKPYGAPVTGLPEHYQGDEVSCSDTWQAYSKLIAGEADVIFVVEEDPGLLTQQSIEEEGIQLNRILIGREAFVFFVNPKNSVDGLTTDDLFNIYSGQVTNWAKVGGKSQKILAFQARRSESRRMMKGKVMGDVEMTKPPQEKNTGSSSWKMPYRFVGYRNYNNALGYTFSFFVRENFPGDQVKFLSINGVPPTPETVKDGSYPLTYDIYAVTVGSPNKHTQKLIDWILSEQGQSLVEKSGYIPIGTTGKELAP